MSGALKFYVSLAVIVAALAALDVRLAIACGVIGLLSLMYVELKILFKAGSYSSFVASAFSSSIEGGNRFYAMSGLSLIIGSLLGFFINTSWLSHAL